MLQPDLHISMRVCKDSARCFTGVYFGPFDIMGVPAGVASYEQLKETAKEAVIDGQPTLVASLDYLIAMKRASGRRKDELMVD